jgi:hypothetical protein
MRLAELPFQIAREFPFFLMFLMKIPSGFGSWPSCDARGFRQALRHSNEVYA